MVTLRKAAIKYLYKWLFCLKLLQLNEVKASINYHQISDAIRLGLSFVVTKFSPTITPSVVRCLLLLCVSV